MSLGDGPPIVVASNIFGDLTGYRGGLPHLKEVTNRLVNLGWRVIRYDVRGMGYSDRNVADVELAGRVLDVQTVVAAIGLDRFALAGLDIGAATAVAYAVGNQARISRLVLLSPWSSGTKYLAIPALRAAYAAEDISNRDPQLFANILGSVATSFQDAELVRLRTSLHLDAASSEDLVAYNAANERIDITDLLPPLTVPALVIHEPAFPFGSLQLCQDVAAGIRGAEFLVVSDHSIAGRIHDETVAGIDRFLRAGTVAGTSLHTKSEVSGDRHPAPNGLTARELQILRQTPGSDSAYRAGTARRSRIRRRHFVCPVVYLAARRYRRALHEAIRAVALEPYAPLAHWVLGRAYLFSKRHQEAVATLERGSELAGHGSMWVSELCYAQGVAGDRRGADRLVSVLYERSRHEYISPVDLAIACLGVGDRSGALDQLEQAFAQRVMRLTGLGDPEFDCLGTKRRSLLRQLRLPGA